MMGKSYEELMHPKNPVSYEPPEGKLIATMTYTKHYDKEGKLVDITTEIKRVNPKPKSE